MSKYMENYQTFYLGSECLQMLREIATASNSGSQRKLSSTMRGMIKTYHEVMFPKSVEGEVALNILKRS